MKQYEIMYVFDVNLSEADRKAKIDKLEAVISAKNEKTDEWGAKDLAYEIKKQHTGFYVINYVHAEPSKIIEFNKLARIEKGLLRLVVINHQEWPWNLKTDAPLPERKPRAPRRDFDSRGRNPRFDNDTSNNEEAPKREE